MVRATRCFAVLLVAVSVLFTPSLFAEKKPVDVMTKLQRDEALQMLQDTARF
jgi:hypothetical protein